MTRTFSLWLGAWATSAVAMAPACDDNKEHEPAERAPGAPSAIDPAPPSAAAPPVGAKAEAEPPVDPAALAPGPGLGIAACDEYVTKYTACINEHAPEATRQPLREGVAKKAEQWKTEAAGPGKDAVEQACMAALDAVKKTSKNWGCTYD